MYFQLELDYGFLIVSVVSICIAVVVTTIRKKK